MTTLTSLAMSSTSNNDLESVVVGGPVSSSPVSSHKMEQKRRPSMCLPLAIIVSIVLVGAVIAVGVVVSGNKKSNRALTTQQKDLSDIIASISDPATLANSGSAQAKARHWLIHDDDLWANNKGTDMVVTKEMAAQRYALAVLYFATSGPSSWIGNNNWLQGQECNKSWTGIRCDTNGNVRSLVLGKCCQ